VVDGPVVDVMVELDDIPQAETIPLPIHRAEPAVSVVIPSAGRPELAARCVRSVLAGGYPRLEVLIVDNRPARPDSLSLKELADSDDRCATFPNLSSA